MNNWISVKDRLPEPEKEVLIIAKSSSDCREVTTAMYEDGTISVDDSTWYWNGIDFIYDEEKDTYIVPEGWWEWRHYNPDDVYNNCVRDTVTHWMPLPEHPEMEETTAKYKNKYISLEKLLKYPIRINHYDCEHGNIHFVYGIESVIEYAENLPTIEVDENKVGHWIHKNGEMYCSVCGEEALMDEIYYESKYCPECGARMEDYENE